MLRQTALQTPLHGQQGLAPNTEKIQLEHYDQLFSKTDHDLLKTVVQAPLLQPKFWLRLHAWDLIRAVWLSVKAGLGQNSHLQNRPLLTSCDWRGSTLGYCTKTLQSLRYPLCVLWTRKQFVRGTLHKPLKTQTLCNGVWIRLCTRQWLEIEKGYVPFFLILVFLAKWGNKSGVKCKQGFFLMLSPLAAECWADTWVKGQAQFAREPVEIWSYSAETNKETGIKIWPRARLQSPFRTD